MDRIAASTYVRALIFSDKAVLTVHALVDNALVKMTRINGSNLWIGPWSPRTNEPGNVTIIATDVDGNRDNVTNFYNLHYDRIKPSQVRSTCIPRVHIAY